MREVKKGRRRRQNHSISRRLAAAGGFVPRPFEVFVSSALEARLADLRTVLIPRPRTSRPRARG